MVRLDSKCLGPHVFSLLVLGDSNVGNRRIVRLQDEVHDCKSLKVLLVGKFKDRFNFKMHETMGMFISCADGEYTLPITSDQTLEECAESHAGENFIEVISQGSKKYVKVGMFNG